MGARPWWEARPASRGVLTHARLRHRGCARRSTALGVDALTCFKVCVGVDLELTVCRRFPALYLCPHPVAGGCSGGWGALMRALEIDARVKSVPLRTLSCVHGTRFFVAFSSRWVALLWRRLAISSASGFILKRRGAPRTRSRVGPAGTGAESGNSSEVFPDTPSVGTAVASTSGRSDRAS